MFADQLGGLNEMVDVYAVEVIRRRIAGSAYEAVYMAIIGDN